MMSVCRSISARTMVAGGRGEFAFRAIETGSYTVRAEPAGFRTRPRHGNVLNASGRLDPGAFGLDVGAITEGAQTRHVPRG